MKEHEITQLTHDEILAILKCGAFDEFIGKRENQFLEAKSSAEPYKVTSLDTKQRIQALAELAKDTVLFANKNAGFIICGLKTVRTSAIPYDVISELSLIARAEFYTEDKLNGILKSNIFPKFRVDVTWYPYKNDNSVGLGVIYIPEQDEHKRDFFVTLGEIEGENFPGLFGVPYRDDDKTVWLKAHELYERSKKQPPTNQMIFEKLEEMHADIKNQAAKPQPRNVDDALRQKLQEVLDEQ